MNQIISVLLIFSSTVIFAQDDVKVYSEQKGNSIIIYADNHLVIPMSVNLTLNLTNMKSDFGGRNKVFILPPSVTKYKLAQVDPSKPTGKIGLNLETTISFGDILKDVDPGFIYDLPFEEGKTYEIFQGYNGKFSHMGENALDFGLDVGEKIFAAREGVVFQKVEHNTKSCLRSNCQKFNNYIAIYHDDGSISEYSHLKPEGAEVEVGDQVKKGQFIGYSGNTGWSSGPHLHFVVFQYDKNGKRKTLRTKFNTKEKGATFLLEKKRYTK